MLKTDPYIEYYKASEPDKRQKGYLWHTAIGLQAVDGLETSEYLHALALRNIKGEITIDEAQELLKSYYEEESHRTEVNRTSEADIVASRITEVLGENAFSFSPNEYISIHRKLFDGVLNSAGRIRNFNIYKKEWVLDGATVTYGSASELLATLEYDLSKEKEFSYNGLSLEQTISHLAVFCSRLWQIHVFEEGNTRTTAVFLIKYLRTLGFDVTNAIFAENSWYFRNALVRANYNDLQNGIHETTEFLELFLRNLLLGENNELHNRSMHISGKYDDYQKVDIRSQKVDIHPQKVDIEKSVKERFPEISRTTLKHIIEVYDALGKESYFGRSAVEAATGVKKSRASTLIKLMLDNNIIEEVHGYGKGKYRFAVPITK